MTDINMDKYAVEDNSSGAILTEFIASSLQDAFSIGDCYVAECGRDREYCYDGWTLLKEVDGEYEYEEG